MKTTPPAPTILGALKNIGTGIYHATARFAGYAAAVPTATTKAGSRVGTNPNSTFSGIQRVGMQFTAEMVTKDNPLAAAYLAQRQNYCSATLNYIPNTGDEGFDKEITNYLHGHDGCGGVFATMGMDCSMQDAFLRTADLEMPVRGDAGLILWRECDSDPIRLIEFSADQLGEIYVYTTGRACSLGRKATGELYETAGSDCVYYAGRYFRGADCIAYKIYERTNSFYGNPKIYAASDVIYFRDPASYRGIRGVTIFAQAIAHMQKSEDLLQAALSAAQRQARTFGRVFNSMGAPESPSYETATDGRVTFFEKVPGGPIEEYYYDGDTAEFAAPNTPSAEVIQGIETADERVALALRTNYAFLISATKVGGAPSRLEVEKADKEFQRIQNTIHRPRLRRIADITLLDALQRRQLVPPRGMTAEQFKRGRWMLPISPSVDAFYDVKENIAMARAGFEAPQDIIAETNRNADDVLLKTKQWAMAVSKMRQDANKELIAAGYKGDITAADIAQTSDNPQQAQAAEDMAHGAPSAQGGAAKPAEAKLEQLELVGAVARLAAPHDVSDEARDDSGKWTAGAGSSGKAKEKESGNAPAAKTGKGKTGRSDHFDMKADMAAQSKWMLEKAKADGHKDLDEVVANHSEKFGKWSSEWRRLNPRTKPPECDERCQRAKQAHVFVGSEIQRYAEEHNEPKFAKAIGGLSFDDNEPIDVVMSDGTGKIRHGIELKTIVKNSNSKITMKGEAMRRKSSWERRNKAAIHTVVIDDSLVFNANGPGKHDESKRVIYYRRGYGSFRINTMHKVTGGIEELKSLIATDPRKLPDAAKTYKGTGQSKA